MNNTFGKRLEQLLLLNGIKNATIAQALNYDVSYISKWITGKAVPSKKNLERVVATAADLILQQGGDENLQLLYNHFGVKTDAALREAVMDTLRNAYFDATGERNDTLYANNAALKAVPRGQYSLMRDYSNELNAEEENQLVIMADLFSLDHISKLQMAGIEERHFRMQKKKKNTKINYIVDLEALDGNSIYDMILLIHMMTCFSKTDFHLYDSPWAAGKVMIAAKDHFAGISLLGKDKQYMCTTSTKEKKTVEDIYENLCEYMDPDKSVFLATNMEHMLERHEYLQSLLSGSGRWLMGHLTEQVLPFALFQKYNKACFGEDSAAYAEAERVRLLAAKMAEKGQIKVLIYDNAFVDFMLTGELDFFNHKVILSQEERKEVLLHLLRFVTETEEPGVKMIKEGFSDDFKYITNPCFFLSASQGYLRLENDLYEDNLMLLNDERIREKFDRFFARIWEEERENVISNKEEMVAKLENLIETADVFI
ncbi:MAG: helix-turn-helix transcriptional regulator [Firmicutes bacterium]|nr:helix-turn-helix transcriptional regulator [Bacillota bacterium]